MKRSSSAGRRGARAPPRAAVSDSREVSLFGSASAGTPRLDFELSSVYQGTEAIEKIRRAIEEGAPYALAFVDMRMPRRR